MNVPTYFELTSDYDALPDALLLDIYNEATEMVLQGGGSNINFFGGPIEYGNNQAVYNIIRKSAQRYLNRNISNSSWLRLIRRIVAIRARANENVRLLRLVERTPSQTPWSDIQSYF